MGEHTVKSYGDNLSEIANDIVRMGEEQFALYLQLAAHVPLRQLSR
jgi:hypothetical protein